MFKEFRTKYLTNFWNVGQAMIILAIVATVYFGIFGGGWAVTGEMTRWGGEFLELFGMDLSGYSYYEITNLDGNPLTRFEGLMLIGMFVGATIAAFMANKVKFRLPASKIRVFQAIVGGLLSGFGARLAFGCNLLDFFTGLPYFSLHTWQGHDARQRPRRPKFRHRRDYRDFSDCLVCVSFDAGAGARSKSQS